jgi:hypothetical protein
MPTCRRLRTKEILPFHATSPKMRNRPLNALSSRPFLRLRRRIHSPASEAKTRQRGQAQEKLFKAGGAWEMSRTPVPATPGPPCFPSSLGATSRRLQRRLNARNLDTAGGRGGRTSRAEARQAKRDVLLRPGGKDKSTRTSAVFQWALDQRALGDIKGKPLDLSPFPGDLHGRLYTRGHAIGKGRGAAG